MASYEQSETDMFCRLETFTKSFSLKVIGYSLTKKINSGNDIVVGSFELGAHKWAIKFHYNGIYGHEWIALLVSRLSMTTTTMALEVEYSLFDHKIGTYSTSDVNVAKSEGNILKQGYGVMRDRFMNTNVFEQSDYLKDDCFILKCSVRLIKPVCVDAKKKSVIVPSSELLHHFDQLWKSSEGADVTFQVDAKTFSAHRIVLAARSPVFKAMFFGPMQEGKAECTRIKDTRPEVFELLLLFVYTDTLPSNEEVSFEMTQHLLVAADRYCLGRLKLICEETLGDSIDVEKAIEILIIADQYNCDQLKEICLDFVASGENLRAVMATDSFKHLKENCPLILGDMLEKVDSKRGSN